MIKIIYSKIPPPAPARTISPSEAIARKIDCPLDIVAYVKTEAVTPLVDHLRQTSLHKLTGDTTCARQIHTLCSADADFHAVLTLCTLHSAPNVDHHRCASPSSG
jgi:hypothetical protein